MRRAPWLVVLLVALGGCTATIWGDTCEVGSCHQLREVVAAVSMPGSLDAGAVAAAFRSMGFGVAEEAADEVRSDVQGGRTVVAAATAAAWSFEARYANISPWTTLDAVNARAAEVQTAQTQDFLALLSGFEGLVGVRHMDEPIWTPSYMVE